MLFPLQNYESSLIQHLEKCTISEYVYFVYGVAFPFIVIHALIKECLTKKKIFLDSVQRDWKQCEISCD